jgi:sugar lactone lactonase YvrE
MNGVRWWRGVTVAGKEAATVLAPAPGSFLAGKTTVTILGSTTPANGDVNPYAVWPVTETVGSLKAGDILVDNFNNDSDDQGTGTTIVDVHPDGKTSVFANLSGAKSGCPGGVGLTTAMVQLKTGWVIVGSLPSTNGVTTTAGPGCLLVVSPEGKLAETLTGAYLDGPWDAAVKDDGNTATLFVTNTLVGLAHSPTASASQGNVVRLTLHQTTASPPKVTAEQVVASGLPERGDPSAFVKGPTGLALGGNGTLYVADNLANAIVAVPDALTRTSPDAHPAVLSSGGQLANPLGLAFGPDGDLLAANAVNGKIVEITTAGRQVGEYYAIENTGQNPAGNGDLFGIAVDQAGTGVLFVKDDENTLALLHS